MTMNFKALWKVKKMNCYKVFTNFVKNAKCHYLKSRKMYDDLIIILRNILVDLKIMLFYNFCFFNRLNYLY